MQNKLHMAQCPKFTLSRRTMKSDPPDGQLGLSIWINLNSISFGEFKCLSAFNIAFWRSVGWHFKFIPMGQQIFPFDLFFSFSGLRNPSNFWTGEISYASGDIKRGQQKHKFYGHEASGAVNLCMNLWWLPANVRLNGLELKLEMMKFVIHIDCGLLCVGGLLMD